GQRLAELVEVRLALRLDAHLQCRARECKAWQLQRMRAIRDERVAGLGARQFGDRDDVSRPPLWRVLLVLAEQTQDVPDPLLLLAAGVVQVSLRRECPGEDPEIAEPAHER